MTLYVGIDVAKNKHDLAILGERGEIITWYFQFVTRIKDSKPWKNI